MMAEKTILVTGGAGFIGTHTVLQLLKEGFRVCIIDNLDTSSSLAVDRLKEVAGVHLSEKLEFVLGDLRNKDDLEKLFALTKFDAVIHFAGLKAVTESVANPRRYFDNNLIGTINLYEIMEKYDCKKMVFSSSSTVYGEPEKMPCTEDSKLEPMNPYGRTMLLLEEIARDIQKAEPGWKIILLRNFNPVGAHESGQLGEDPRGTPNNLMPNIHQVAVGRLPVLNVYGDDYPTKDNTVRDYVHVVDLADGHVTALRKLFTTEDIGCVAYNLGTGCGTSVLQMVAAFEKASSKEIPVNLCPRRPGDVIAVYASTEKAEKELGWKAKFGVDEMCRDQWKWASNNPEGFRTKSINSLPNDLLKLIMRKLSTKEAVCMSIVSKRWHHIWGETLVESKKLELVCGLTTEVSDFLDLVKSMLEKIRGFRYSDIEKLSVKILGELKYVDEGEVYYPDLDYYAYPSTLTGRALNFMARDLLVQFPNLLEIHLDSCRLYGDWCRPINCCNIVKLKLSKCVLDGGELSFMISKCPVLHELEFNNNQRMGPINVGSPSLKTLLFVGESVGYIKLRTPSLERFEITESLFKATYITFEAIPNTVALNFDFVRPEDTSELVFAAKNLFRKLERFGFINLRIPPWLRSLSEQPSSDDDEEEEMGGMEVEGMDGMEEIH